MENSQSIISLSLSLISLIKVISLAQVSHHMFFINNKKKSDVKKIQKLQFRFQFCLC